MSDLTQSENRLNSFPSTDIDPYSEAFLKDPYPYFEELRALGPLVRLARYDCLVTTNYRIAADALKDHASFCSSAGVGLSNFHKQAPWRPPSLLLETDPPEHTRARKVLNQVLNPRVLSLLQDEFEVQAESMVANLVARSEFDAVSDLAEAYPLKVFPDAIGLPGEGRENLLPYGSMVFNALGPRNALFEQAFENAKRVQSWIMEHCLRKNLSPDGLGAKIHQAAADEGFSEEDASLLVRSTLSAGVDTTVNALGSAIYCFVRNPDQWELFRADLKLAQNAFDEVLRYEGTAHSFFRTTTKPVTIGAQLLPEGEKVLILLAGANRDPNRWADASKFLVQRDCKGHLGFGMGIHGCVGKRLARMEGELVLKALAKRVRSFQLTGEPEFRLNNSLRGLASLPVKVCSVDG